VSGGGGGTSARELLGESNHWKRRIADTAADTAIGGGNQNGAQELEAAQCAARTARPLKFLRGTQRISPKCLERKPGAAHGSHHPDPCPKESMKRSQVVTLAQCPSCEGPLRIGRMGIAISRRESAANLGARLRYSDRPVYALRQTRARAAQAPDFWCPRSGGGTRGAGGGGHAGRAEEQIRGMRSGSHMGRVAATWGRRRLQPQRPPPAVKQLPGWAGIYGIAIWRRRSRRMDSGANERVASVENRARR
jgi:hypothetical protein